MTSQRDLMPDPLAEDLLSALAPCTRRDDWWETESPLKIINAYLERVKATALQVPPANGEYNEDCQDQPKH